MTRFIYYKKGKTAKTGRMLTKYLGVRSQRSIERRLCLPPNTNDKLVRWGTTESYGETTEIPTLNKLDAITNSSNKLKALELFREAGVSVPFFSVNKDDIVEHLHTKKFVGRTTYHQGGSNFNIVTTSDELYSDNLSTHWLELLPIHKEWRVHVFRGEVIGVSRKTDEDVEHRITNRYTRNHKNGWRFIRCDIDRVQNRLKELGIQAVQTLGLDFGAVDIILSSGENRKYYVLEVNSAPSIEDGSTILSKYLEKIKEWYNDN